MILLWYILTRTCPEFLLCIIFSLNVTKLHSPSTSVAGKKFLNPTIKFYIELKKLDEY